MRRVLIRDPLFWIGLLLFAALMTLSVGNTLFRDGQVDQITNLYSADGTLLATSPLEPSSEHWLGTDRAGNDLLQLLIEGAKWTIGVCFTVAFVRIALALLIGVPLAFRGKRLYTGLRLLLDGFLIIPISLLALFILLPALLLTDPALIPSMSSRVLLEVSVLTLLGLPALLLYLISETRQLRAQEFMLVARTLGGSPFYQFRTHIWPHLLPTLTIVFMQQFVQTLMVLIHISLFGVFFGGSLLLFGDGVAPTIFEWASQFGYYFLQFTALSWINHMFLVPAIALALLVFFANLLTSRLERAYRLRRQQLVHAPMQELAEAEAAATQLSDPFEPVRISTKP